MSNHLTHIDIKKYKCFENFKVENLSRVNLITGKNNVGKTAFLESAHIHTSAEKLPVFFVKLSGAKFRRERINIFVNYENEDRIVFLEQANGFDVDSNIHQTSFNIDYDNGIKAYNFTFNNQNIYVNSQEFSQEFEDSFSNIFIDNFGMSDSQIVNFFANIQKLDEEDYLDKALNDFDHNITNFKTPNNKPQCKIDGEYRKLTELGDGTKHLVSLVVALFSTKDGFLFIDEIDNGIHYEKLDAIWEIILTLSKKHNTQVFATTHSKECLESYARVAKKLADKEITVIEFGKSDNELKNIVFKYDEVISEVSQGFDMRGWIS